MTSKQMLDKRYSDHNYQQQLDQKVTRFQQELSRFGDYPILIHPSKPLNFRMRAEFRIWHENGALTMLCINLERKSPILLPGSQLGDP